MATTIHDVRLLLGRIEGQLIGIMDNLSSGRRIRGEEWRAVLSKVRGGVFLAGFQLGLIEDDLREVQP